MNGKRIIIIGATSGIGYEVARIYIERGYTVGLAGRRVEKLEEFAAFLKTVEAKYLETLDLLKWAIESVNYQILKRAG